MKELSVRLFPNRKYQFAVGGAKLICNVADRVWEFDSGEFGMIDTGTMLYVKSYSPVTENFSTWIREAA